MSNLQKTEITEWVVAAPGDEGWHFAEQDLSSLFKYAAGEDWSSTVYAPYYKEFWQPVLDALQGQKVAVEVMMECAYDYGNIDEENMHGLMDEWRTNRHTRTKPNMLAVSEKAPNGEVTTVHLVVTNFEIRTLSDIT